MATCRIPGTERRRGGIGDRYRGSAIFHPEDHARNQIDAALAAAGWLVQSRAQMNLGAAFCIAVREFPTGSGPVDYALFVGRDLCGVIEAKPAGTTLSGFAEQAARYIADVPEHLIRRAGQVRFEYVTKASFSSRAGAKAASRSKVPRKTSFGSTKSRIRRSIPNA